jgi:hypothetical protein
MEPYPVLKVSVNTENWVATGNFLYNNDGGWTYTYSKIAAIDLAGRKAKLCRATSWR